MCVCVQKPSSEWDRVEKSTAGPAWHAAERLHLSKTGDMSPGIARDYQICTKMYIIHTLSCVFPPPEPLNSEFYHATYQTMLKLLPPPNDLLSSLTSAGLCWVTAVFQPCGERTPGRAAHALFQGILNMTRNSTPRSYTHTAHLGSPNI